MKKIIIAFVLLIMALPLSAQAHTTLTDSTPSEGEVLTKKLEEVQLTFGTAIEPGSTMAIEGEETSYELENVAVSENMLTGSLAEELPNGAYTVHWKIIGADGHPIEGNLPFEIKIETTEEPVVEEEGTENEEPAVEEEGTAEEELAAEEEQTETPADAEPAGTSGEQSNTLITVLIAAAALVLIAGAFRLLKKKR